MQLPLLAGLRPPGEAAAASPVHLHLGLLGDLQRVINLDSQIPDRAFELRVSEQDLHCPEILGPLVDQGRLGAPQRMGAVRRGVQTPPTPKRYINEKGPDFSGPYYFLPN